MKAPSGPHRGSLWKGVFFIFLSFYCHRVHLKQLPYSQLQTEKKFPFSLDCYSFKFIQTHHPVAEKKQEKHDGAVEKKFIKTWIHKYSSHSKKRVALLIFLRSGVGVIIAQASLAF